MGLKLLDFSRWPCFVGNHRAVLTVAYTLIDNSESSSGSVLVSNVKSTADLSLVGDRAAVSRARVQNWQLATTGWTPLQLGMSEKRGQELKAFLQDVDLVMKLQTPAQGDDRVEPDDHPEENTQDSKP